MPAAPVIAAVAAAVGTAASIYQGERSASQARKAQDQQQKAAARQEWQADHRHLPRGPSERPRGFAAQAPHRPC